MKGLLWLALVGLLGLLALGTWELFPLLPLPAWEEATQAFGAQNGVAAIVLGVRLWDTLFEVLVYALAIVGVGIMVRPLHRKTLLPPVRETPFLIRAADLLLGPIAVFAIYVTASGHIGPGGGFPAGALLGSGLLLLALAKGMDKLGHKLSEGTLAHAGSFDILGLLGASAATVSLGLRGTEVLVLANILIMIEVAIGAWIVLYHFTGTRGEV